MLGLDAMRRHRQVISLWLMAVVVALGCVALGWWQWSRYEDKRSARALVQRNYDAPAVPLSDVLPGPQAAFNPSLQWRPVRVTGRYAADLTTLVRNRVRTSGENNPPFGYEVLVPLVLDDGSALLVDRGWLPNGSSGTSPGAAPDAVPVPPSGTVEVVARLLPSEDRRPGRLPPAQVGSIAVPQVAAMTGRTLYSAYGALVSEAPPVSPAPTPLGRPVLDGGEGINVSYAVQWMLFASLALGFPYWWIRRQRLDAAPVPSARKRRIWDDEDE